LAPESVGAVGVTPQTVAISSPEAFMNAKMRHFGRTSRRRAAQNETSAGTRAKEKPGG